MFEFLGISPQALFGQLLLGLINGSFYALLSLGLAVIFGMLNIINFAHGAFYMVGAFCAWFLLQYLGLGHWSALIITPVIVGLFGMLLERTLLKQIQNIDHLYGLLLTFGLALILQGLFRNYFGSSGLPYPIPEQLQGGHNLGFMFLPNYRAWVIIFSVIVCLLTWYAIERTKLGAYLRAATENPTMVRAFGINVDRVYAGTFGLGAALAAIAAVLVVPISQAHYLMGGDPLLMSFIVVIIGGLGSLRGTLVAALLIERLPRPGRRGR